MDDPSWRSWSTYPTRMGCRYCCHFWACHFVASPVNLLSLLAGHMESPWFMLPNWMYLCLLHLTGFCFIYLFLRNAHDKQTACFFVSVRRLIWMNDFKFNIDTTVLWKHLNYCISCFYNIKCLPFIVKFFNSIKEYVKSPDSAGTELHSHT